MRFFSRIGTWLRARGTATSSSGAVAVLAPALDPSVVERLPRTPPEAFQQRLRDALEASRTQVYATELDPCVRVIALSQREIGADADIDDALRQVEAGGTQWSSLTWSALRDARPPFSPSPRAWGGEVAHLLDGDAGLIFFVDVEAVAVAVAQAADQLGLTSRIEDGAAVVRVSDGRFQAIINTGAIVAEALWTGCGPLTAVMRRVRQLPHELRSFVALLRGLERAFVGTRFTVVGDHIVAQRAVAAETDDGDVKITTVDYRHLAASARVSGVGIDTFLEGALLEDLIEHDGEVVALLRSPAWLKAWPEMLAEPFAEGGVISIGVEAEGRVRPLRTSDGESPARFSFLMREARRQLPFLRVEGHAFVVDRAETGSGQGRAIGLVSDRAATLLLDPALVRGLCEQLGPVPDVVDVAVVTENLIVVAPAGTADDVVDEAIVAGARLEGDVFDDGADALKVEKTMTLPAVGAGHFELSIVPEEYFALNRQAFASTSVSALQIEYLRGLALEVIGHHDKAAELFEKALRGRSDDGELCLALGRCLSALGKHARAVSILRRAAAVLPNHADLQNALGVALYKTGSSTDARAAFLRAVQLSPDEVGYLVNLGRTCCDEELFTEARAVLEHALRMEPSSAEAHASMAVLCHRTGERQRAMHHARAALAEQPDDDVVAELMRIVDDDADPTL